LRESGTNLRPAPGWCALHTLRTAFHRLGFDSCNQVAQYFDARLPVGAHCPGDQAGKRSTLFGGRKHRRIGGIAGVASTFTRRAGLQCTQLLQNVGIAQQNRLDRDRLIMWLVGADSSPRRQASRGKSQPGSSSPTAQSCRAHDPARQLRRSGTMPKKDSQIVHPGAAKRMSSSNGVPRQLCRQCVEARLMAELVRRQRLGTIYSMTDARQQRSSCRGRPVRRHAIRSRPPVSSNVKAGEAAGTATMPRVGRSTGSKSGP